MPSGVYKRKPHKEDCQCCSCKSKRGEYFGKNSPLYGTHHSKEHKQALRKSKSEQGRKNIKEALARPEVITKRIATRRVNGRPWISEEGKRNMREALARPEVKEKYSGKNCNWYRDGSCIDTKYHPNFTSSFKKSIRKRDNYICMICKLTEEQLGHRIRIHHIHYDPMNNCSNLNDFVGLCRSCHAMTTSGDRVYWQKVCEEIIEKNYCLRRVG